MIKGNRRHVCLGSLTIYLRTFTRSSMVYITEQVNDRLPCHLSNFSLSIFFPHCTLWVFIKETETWSVSCFSYLQSFHLHGPLFLTNRAVVHIQNLCSNMKRHDLEQMQLSWFQFEHRAFDQYVFNVLQIHRIQTLYESHCTLLWVNIILSLFSLHSLKIKDKSCVTKARFFIIDDFILTEVSSLLSVN